MSDNKYQEIQTIDNIEEAIAKENFKLYECKHLSDIQEIGTGGFGKVFRVKWKNLEYLALKSFFNLNNVTVKEIVRELKLQRDIDFHNNIIRFYGITKLESGQDKQPRDYCLVMEYADGGTLRTYMKKNFERLTWNDKCNLAYQLSCAISWLHNEGIVHCDLHSRSILIHQNNIKLADLGLSKRIEEATKSQSKLFEMIPYVDPKSFSRRSGSNNTTTQIYSLNEKSDIYSVGVLLWEISSGQPPFGDQYDIGLAVEISQGLRETPIPNTPEDYIKVYTECWDGDPDNRPTIYQVVDNIKALIPKTDGDYQVINVNKQESGTPDINNSSLNYELSQIIQSLDTMTVKEIELIKSKCEQIINQNNQDILSESESERDLSTVVNETVAFIFKIINEGKESTVMKQHILDYFNNYDVNSQEIYNWLLNHQNDSNSLFLLGYFNYLGIETNINYEKSFELFVNPLLQDYTLVQFCIGRCYQYGQGIMKNENLTFEYYKKAANEDLAAGQINLGYCYENGIGVEKDFKMAIYWYEKSANNGNLIAMNNLAFCNENGIGVEEDFKAAVYWYERAANNGNSAAMNNLGICYEYGKGVEKDYKKAFELYEKSAEGGYLDGITMAGNCYYNGIGTNVNYEKAFELFQKAVNLGDSHAQYNLALMYELGKGIEKDINQAIYLYEKSAEQNYQEAQNRLKVLLKEY